VRKNSKSLLVIGGSDLTKRTIAGGGTLGKRESAGKREGDPHEFYTRNREKWTALRTGGGRGEYAKRSEVRGTW